MIYKGSQKEGKVYKGGTKIGKIYKGSQLVYQSQKSLRLYGYGNVSDTSIYYLIGGTTTSNPYLAMVNPSEPGIAGKATITSITGTLGQSGSSATVIFYSGSSSFNSIGTYSATYNINNVILYRYLVDGTVTYRVFWVMEGSTVGSYALYTRWININSGFGFPSSVGSDTFTYYWSGNQTSGIRNSSLDKTWTINGVY